MPNLRSVVRSPAENSSSTRCSMRSGSRLPATPSSISTFHSGSWTPRWLRLQSDTTSHVSLHARAMSAVAAQVLGAMPESLSRWPTRPCIRLRPRRIRRSDPRRETPCRPFGWCRSENAGAVSRSLVLLPGTSRVLAAERIAGRSPSSSSFLRSASQRARSSQITEASTFAKSQRCLTCSTPTISSVAMSWRSS